MKLIAFLMLLVSGVANAGDYNYYVKIGTGYKIDEPTHSTVKFNGVKYRMRDNYGGPLTARMEIGVETGNITFGVAHHSHWLEGWPVNEEPEYYKTEVFIDYKYTFGGN